MRTQHPSGRIRAALVIVWVTAALVVASPVGAASPPTTLYVSVGDSLAWGDGASVPTDTGYTALLADYFAGTPHGGAKAWTNLAVRGETTTSFLGGGQLGATFAAIGDPSTDTRVVTVSLGGNDVGALLNDPGDACVQDPFGLACQVAVVGALQTAGQNYPFVLGSIAAALAAEDVDPEQVFVMTVHNPFGGLGAPYEGPVDGVLLGTDGQIDCANQAGFGLNDIIACTALAFGMTVVDGYGAIGDNALTLTHIGEGTFDTHPNDLGYELLAKAHRLASR
jgi:lysophospholipase L1-like esterase